METTFQVLGPVTARAAGRRVVVSTGKTRALLAALLLRPNEVVPTTYLVSALWSDAPPSTAKSTLHSHVMRLRRTLGGRSSRRSRDASVGGEDRSAAAPNAVPDVPIRTLPGGYLIEANEDTLDLLRFTRLFARTRELATTGDRPAEARALADALALWRGSALCDVDSTFLHRTQVPRLIESRLLLIERRIELELAQGSGAELIGELSALTADHPHRERFWGQLMEALYATGRQAEALSAYRRLRHVLADDLGIDPSLELQRLERRILRGEPREPENVSPAPPDDGPRSAAPHSGRSPTPSSSGPAMAGCTLPPEVTGFVGRAALVERICMELSGRHPRDAPAIVVLHGPPAVGKTALAVHIAHRVRACFPDGQWYVGLTTGNGFPRSTMSVLTELLTSAGVPAADQPTSEVGSLALLRARLADRRVLLVVDDLTNAAQLAPLLPGTAGSAVLVTSRTHGKGLAVLYGAQVFRLPVLTPDESVQLLWPHIGPRCGERAIAARLAELCGHLPLALRIAAAQLASCPELGLVDYVKELDEGDRLKMLAIGREPALSVREAIDRSYRLLDDGAKRLFRKLSVLSPPEFDVSIAAALTGPSAGRSSAPLDELVDANLVERTAGGRFRIPELLRLYAVATSRT